MTQYHDNFVVTKVFYKIVNLKSIGNSLIPNKMYFIGTSSTIRIKNIPRHDIDHPTFYYCYKFCF